MNPIEVVDAVGLAPLFSEQGIAFAGAALYILPALLIYTYFQEDILLGIQLSDMK